jgi:hypothetical protein
MTDVINYNEFMSKQTILHSDEAKNFNDGLLFFIENSNYTNIITYNTVDTILFKNVNTLGVDSNNNYYYEYSTDRKGDIIDNINFDSKGAKFTISYYIGHILYDPSEVKEFIIISAPFHEFKIRITFLETPANELEFSIHSRVYILSNDYRKQLCSRSTIITNTNIYKEGMCGKLNNFIKEGGSMDDHRAYIDDV